MGYHRAGFEVVGVDANPQPRYPFEFVQRHALTLGMSFYRSFDAIHASPPCQKHTELTGRNGNADEWPDYIGPTRAILRKAGRSYIIENVDGARGLLIDPVLLCGSMFKLGAAGHQLQRHRWFETSFPLSAPRSCDHRAPVIGVYGGHVRCRSAKHGGRRTRDFEGLDKPALAREAMGMDWGTMAELSEAVPPAYTQHIGEQLRAILEADQTRKAA